jgi:hypothetical protein
MPTLTWWEQLIIGTALTAITGLESTVTNPVILSGLKATVTFLESLLGGQSEKPGPQAIGAKLHAFLKKVA